MGMIKRRRRSRQGFTLIEVFKVMWALVFFGALIVGFLTILAFMWSAILYMMH